MTREQLLQWAQQCGFGGQARVTNLKRLEQFAALVAAAERKRLAWIQEHWTEYEHNIAAAEREACAKVCDRLAMEHYKNDIAQILEKCADAIRARGEK